MTICLQDALRQPLRPQAPKTVKMWMAANRKTGELNPRAFWLSEPGEAIHEMHERGGWLIVPVEVRRID